MSFAECPAPAHDVAERGVAHVAQRRRGVAGKEPLCRCKPGLRIIRLQSLYLRVLVVTGRVRGLGLSG